ncbi:MAG: septal ring factor EnvC (AmiA/AmiB activator) [Planctomycetota bacterium]
MLLFRRKHMTPMKTILLAIIGSAVVSTFICITLIPAAETDSLDASATDQLASIHRKLELLDQDIEEIRDNMVTKDTMSKSQRGFLRREALATVEAQLDALKNSTPSTNPREESRTGGPTEDVVAAIVDDRLKKAEEAALAKKASQTKRAVTDWARNSARKRSRQLAKQLSLSTDQAERLTVALEDQTMTTTPLWGTLKDDQASAQDRLAAIATMRDSSQELLDQARNILSTEQYTQFEAAQQQTDEKTTGWFQTIESGLTGGGK